MLDVERHSPSDAAVTEKNKFEKGGEKRKEWLQEERGEVKKELVSAQEVARTVEAQLKKTNQDELDENGHQALARLEAQFEKANKAAGALATEFAEINKEWFELRRKEIFVEAINAIKDSQEIPDAWKSSIVERFEKSDETNSRDYFLSTRVPKEAGEARIQMLTKGEAELGPLDKAEKEVDPLFLIASDDIKRRLKRINEPEREFQLVAHGKLPLRLEQQFKEEVRGLNNPSNEEIAAIRKKYMPDPKSLEKGIRTDWRLMQENLISMKDDPRFRDGLRAAENISDAIHKQMENARREME